METETSVFLHHWTFSVRFSVSLFPSYSLLRAHHTHTHTGTHTAINHFTSFHKWVQKHTALSCIEHLTSGFWKSIYPGTGCFCPHSPSSSGSGTHTHLHTHTYSHTICLSDVRTNGYIWKQIIFSYVTEWPIDRDEEIHTSTYYTHLFSPGWFMYFKG